FACSIVAAASVAVTAMAAPSRCTITAEGAVRAAGRSAPDITIVARAGERGALAAAAGRIGGAGWARHDGVPAVTRDAGAAASGHVDRRAAGGGRDADDAVADLD